jgi:hypothetical protein
MSIPRLTVSDLSLLSRAFPDLTFDDDERRAVLLEGDSSDVNAAPGSGKTTMLAAKLYLLARRWTYPRRGICVISHTNVAREEILRRLEASVEGSRLLSYPHFVGTIHAFVNQFLALPYLRSRGVKVDIIDDNAFGSRALLLARRNPIVRTWLQNKPRAEAVVATMQFEGEELSLVSQEGALPGPATNTWAALRKIKRDLSMAGVFRFEDMFALAARLLRDSPSWAARVAHRFPVVFVDEMQDTSWLQEQLLARLFATGVVIQRFGDVNQSILDTGTATENRSFPLPGYLSIRTSKRFGDQVASAVTAVQQKGHAVIGARTGVDPRPTLILFPSARVEQVIPHFGQLVLERFSAAELVGAQVKAICMRKGGDANATPGRHLRDYWPSYPNFTESTRAREENFWALLTNPTTGKTDALELQSRAIDIRRAVLLVLRAAQSIHVRQIRDARSMLGSLQIDGVSVEGLRRVCRDLTVARSSDTTAAERERTIATLYEALATLLPEELTYQQFAALTVFELTQTGTETSILHARACVAEAAGRTVEVSIGTTASAKGETHLATLVLESHGGNARRFDLEHALPLISGNAQMNPKASPLHRAQFKNLYVAMSRPSRFLCLAMNIDRAKTVDIDALAQRGWSIDRME